MNNNPGAYRLLKETSWEQRRDGLTWLWYTFFGVALPMIFAWLEQFSSQATTDFLTLFRDGQLYIYSASFWVFAMYSFEKARLGPGVIRSLPFIAIAFISYAYSLIQSQALVEESVITKFVYVSIICFALSMALSYFGNLISVSKAMLEEKARITDTLNERNKNQSELEQKFRELGEN